MLLYGILHIWQIFRYFGSNLGIFANCYNSIGKIIGGVIPKQNVNLTNGKAEIEDIAVVDI